MCNDLYDLEPTKYSVEIIEGNKFHYQPKYSLSFLYTRFRLAFLLIEKKKVLLVHFVQNIIENLKKTKP